MYSALIGFFLVAIITSFLCSLWEAVLLSITPSYARIKLQEGRRIGRHLEAFKEDIDRPLAAILTLNTIAHTIGAVGVGAQSIAIWSDTSPLITGLLVPVAMTLAILVLSEIIPKTIGAVHWEEFAPFTVSSLRIVLFVLAPVVKLSTLLTKFLRKDEKRSILSRSDFLALAEIGEQEGVIEQKESEIIRKLLSFSEVEAGDVMTPRNHVHSEPGIMTVSEFIQAEQGLRFSRIPIYEKLDPMQREGDIVGYVLKDEVLAAGLQGKLDEQLDTFRRELITVEQHYPIPKLFNRFLENREHISLVVDDQNNMLGIVTMEDVIEILLGMDIADESDSANGIRAVAREHWKKRAMKAGIIVDQTNPSTFPEVTIQAEKEEQPPANGSEE
jgi:CBS domain containing-hemolysin-like protein